MCAYLRYNNIPGSYVPSGLFVSPSETEGPAPLFMDASAHAFGAPAEVEQCSGSVGTGSGSTGGNTSPKPPVDTPATSSRRIATSLTTRRQANLPAASSVPAFVPPLPPAAAAPTNQQQPPNNQYGNPYTGGRGGKNKAYGNNEVVSVGSLGSDGFEADTQVSPSDPGVKADKGCRSDRVTRRRMRRWFQ